MRGSKQEKLCITIIQTVGSQGSKHLQQSLSRLVLIKPETFPLHLYFQGLSGIALYINLCLTHASEWMKITFLILGPRHVGYRMAL